MPNIAEFHPQIVHFVVALLVVGVGMRIVSLTRLLPFTNHAAATLLLIGTVAAYLAVRSGTEAHGPVERIPGARDLVVEHEKSAEKTAKIFYGVVALELLALGLVYRGTLSKYVYVAHAASAAVGVFGTLELVRAAGHGGELVYNFAGGPGIRSGNPKDVERLLLAGLYAQSREDRKAGKHAEAATLVNEMTKRYGADTTVRFLRVESLRLDSKDYPAALAALDSIVLAPTDARFGARKATMAADIHLAMGHADSARARLTSAITAFPQSTRLKAKLDSIK